MLIVFPTISVFCTEETHSVKHISPGPTNQSPKSYTILYVLAYHIACCPLNDLLTLKMLVEGFRQLYTKKKQIK